MREELVKTSKFLSSVLRHRPESIGLRLDAQGWVGVDELLAAASRHGRRISRELLEEVVATSDKRRFALSDDGMRISANQGHSVRVDLALAPVEPPEVLYHGTASRFVDSIRAQGLVRGRRHHVHLSPDAATAAAVGKRHGRPVVLVVRARRMHRAGRAFYVSANGVWLTDHVPAEHIEIPD